MEHRTRRDETDAVASLPDRSNVKQKARARNGRSWGAYTYRDLLDRQKDERADLADRQELGLRSHDLLDRAYPTQSSANAANEVGPDEAVDNTLDRFGVKRGREHEQGGDVQRGEVVAQGSDEAERSPLRDPVSGIAGGLLSILGQLGESLTGGAAKPPPKTAPEPDALERFNVKRGQAPPGDANERAEHERQRAYEERQARRDWHHVEPER